MITLASFIVFLAFYSLYYTSKRAALSYDLGFEKWIKNNPKRTKFIGTGLLCLAYCLWLLAKSLCCGTLLFFIQLMTIGSLIIILSPLKKINCRTIFILFTIIAIVEFYYN